MPISAPLPPRDLTEAQKAYISHLGTVEAVFNEHAQAIGLGVKLDASTAKLMAEKGRGLASILRYADRADDTGVLHNSQLMTALDAIGEMLTSPKRNGLILGAMQSGKTTTSLALQFAGPIIYLLNGSKIYPVYLITSHTSQEDQTKTELKRFLELYGEIDVVLDEEHRCTISEYYRSVAVDPNFSVSPTINTYREHILGGAFPDTTLVAPELENFVQRRVRGESLRRVAEICKRANDKGFSPVLIIDEPQFGASDRFVKTGAGLERRACVLLQMFAQIDDALGDDAGEHTFIGLSATPYELHDIESVWTVRQYLTSAYVGFNYFAGKIIDGSADVTPPRTLSLSQLAEEFDIPFLENVSMAIYDGSPARFRAWATRNDFDGSQDEYKSFVEDALREAIMEIVQAANGRRVGICVRLLNNNARSHEFLQKLALDPAMIEVIEYFGGDHRGESVKRAIAKHGRRERPFLIAVTNRARMGDAFPADVEWFFEFSQKASDLNALLQGLLGRACGYGKKSAVVMSEDNALLVEDYKYAQGGYIYKPSRHSKIVGGYRRGAPTSLIRIKAEWDDPIVRKFFQRLETEVVAPVILQNRYDLKAQRAKDRDFRTAPILRIAEEIGLFEHLERKDFRSRFLPSYPEFKIARAGDRILRSGSRDEYWTYQLDENGDCRFTFRSMTGQHSGMRSRGIGKADATDEAKAGNKLEPQINMEKFDLVSGEKIAERLRPGYWRSVMITLPLVGAIREIRAGEETFPLQTSPFQKEMSEEENERAEYSDDEEAA